MSMVGGFATYEARAAFVVHAEHRALRACFDLHKDAPMVRLGFPSSPAQRLAVIINTGRQSLRASTRFSRRSAAGRQRGATKPKR